MYVELALLIGAVNSHLATPTPLVVMVTLSSDGGPVVSTTVGLTMSSDCTAAIDSRLHTTYVQ